MENRINLLKKEVKYQNYINLMFIFTMCFYMVGSILQHDTNTERLNEHKRLLIAQQEQINKLILNAEYNKIRYEKKIK